MTTDFQKGLVAGLSMAGLSVSKNGTSDYNELINIPLFIDEEGNVAISEKYQAYFETLSKDTNTTNYDELINIPLKIIEPDDGVIEGLSVSITKEEYKHFFKNLIKHNITELPIASATTLGGIKIGEGLTISEDGVLSVNLSSTTFSNDTILIATSAEILEDKNILINDTIVGDYLYSPSQIILINDTILGGLYTNG